MGIPALGHNQQQSISDETAGSMPESFSEALQRLMIERGIGVRALAREVPCDASHISKLRLGRKGTSEEMAKRLDEIFGADGSLAALRPKPQKPQKSRQERGGATAGTVSLGINPDLWDDDMERRALLQLAALGMSAGSLGSTGESIRQLLALALNSEPRGIDDWHLTLSDHLYAIRSRPPAQARDGLIVDLIAVQRQLPAAKPGEAVELRRVAAALSVLYANALSRLGDHGSAIHWWRTAKAAADATGDLDLRLLVRCEEADTGLYGQRDPATVVQLVDAAERLGGAAASIWSADLAGTRATAFTLQGRHEEALRALETCDGLTGGEAHEGILPALWSEDRLQFAASWVHAGAGREAKADAARDFLLAGNRGYQSATNIRLHEALCTVVNGGIDRGARQAAEILSELSPAEQNHMINETGKAVLRAVPTERRDRPAVRELRALTS